MVDSGWDGVVLQLGWWRRLWTGTKGVAARGGERCGGSYRSGEGEYFWGSPEKLFGGGGRRSQPKRTYKEDLECEIVMVKMAKYMSWLTYDEPIGDLDTLVDKVDNPNLQSTLQVLLSFEVIFDEEKLGSSEKVSLDDSCTKI
nr:hypothetical protein [Tanacetum cinerariifolium]